MQLEIREEESGNVIQWRVENCGGFDVRER